MKVSVKYGLFASIAVIAWMLIGFFLELDKKMGVNGGPLALVFYLMGIYFSIKHTKDKETTGALDPKQLLKAGLITSAIVSVTFGVYHFFLFEVLGRGKIGVPSEIMALIPFILINLMIGGLISVMLAFFYARKTN